MGLKAKSVGEQDAVEGTTTSVDQLSPPLVGNRPKLTSPGPVHVDNGALAVA